MGHDHSHTHTHTHDGVEHTHTHSHPHDHAGHEHHTHSHDAAGVSGDSAKVLALLTYMLDHNVSHCAELKDLCGALSGEAQHQLLHAVECFDHANAHLKQVVDELSK